MHVEQIYIIVHLLVKKQFGIGIGIGLVQSIGVSVSVENLLSVHLYIGLSFTLDGVILYYPVLL